MTIIERIDQRLADLQLSARKACELAGLGESYIRDLRRNAAQSPRVEDLGKLAPVLQTNLEWLTTGAGDPNQIADADSTQVVSILPGLDAKRKSQLAEYAKFLAQQKKREAGE